MKIRFESDDNLSLNKIVKLINLTVLVRSVFQEANKYYFQNFLDKCLYELLTLEDDRIDISEGIDISQTDASKECDICHYWYLLDKSSKFSFCYIDINMDEKWKPVDPMKSHFLLYFVWLFFLTEKSGSIKCFIAVFVPNH